MATKPEVEPTRTNNGKLISNEPQFSWTVFCVCVVGMMILLVGLVFTGDRNPEYAFFIYFVPIQGIFVALICYGGFIGLKRLACRSTTKRRSAEKADEEAGVLKEDLEQDFFNNIVKINFGVTPVQWTV